MNLCSKVIKTRRCFSHSRQIMWGITRYKIKLYKYTFEIIQLFSSPSDISARKRANITECKNSLKIYGECTGREQDLLDSNFRNNSPNYDLNSQLNPFVLHGNNLDIVLSQHGLSNEYLFGLQNNSKACIKYEWDDFEVSEYSCEVCVEPKRGHHKAGFYKAVQSVSKIPWYLHDDANGWWTAPIKCSVFKISIQQREFSWIRAAR